MARRVILDCDTGSDDAIAIMLAALDPRLSLLGVSCVHGNAALDVVIANTLGVLDVVGRPGVPVLAGAAGPAPGGGVLPVPASSRTAFPERAVEWLVATLRSATAPVTLVPTGPLTNIAAAVAADPAIAKAVDEVVLMGGAHEVDGPERNMRADPAAAAAVLAAGFARVVVVPLDATNRVALAEDDCARLEALGTPAARLTATLVRSRIDAYAQRPGFAGVGRAPIHDALTIAYLLDPAVVTLREARVDVDADGRTVMHFEARVPNARVAVDADRERVLSLLLGGLGRAPV